jgi:uncharacterized protein
MDDTTPARESTQKNIPFSNLYLLSGLVHGQNRATMYLLTILLVLFGYFSYQLAILYPLAEKLVQNGYTETDIMNNPSLIFDSTALRMDRNLVLLLEMGMFVFAFMGLYVGVRRIHFKPFVSVLTGYERFRFRRFWFSFAVWGVMIGALAVYSYITTPEELELVFNPAGFAVSFLILLLLMPIQTGLEEIFFRGYLVQGMALVFRSGIVPLFVSAAFFGAAHMGNPEVSKHGTGIMLVYYCGSALFLGALTLIDEGIELAWGLHFANNLVSALLLGSKDSVVKPYTVFMAHTEDPYLEVMVWFGMAVLSFLIFRWRYRWKNFSLLVR